MDNPPRGLVAATRAQAEDMAPHVRPEHIREVRDMAGVAGGTALLLSFAASREAYAYLPRHARVPVFMMGVEDRNMLTGGAMVWMLGTRDMSRHGAGVLRAARWGVARAFAVTGADFLHQSIPAWYETGLRFALRLGFGLVPARRSARGHHIWNITLNRKGYEMNRGG